MNVNCTRVCSIKLYCKKKKKHIDNLRTAMYFIFSHDLIIPDYKACLTEKEVSFKGEHETSVHILEVTAAKRCLAINTTEINWFLWSLYYSFFNPGVPAAAEITDLAKETNDVEINLKWKEAENNGASITQYTVYRRTVREDGTSLNWTKIKEITDTSDRQVVVHLEKGKAYAIVVTATNRFGEGVKEVSKIREIKVLGGRCILVFVS